MNRDNIGTEVKKRATPEDDSMTFSYTVARPFDRREKNTSKWTVVEKGYDKSSPDRQLEISYRSIISAASLLKCYLLETPCNPSVRLLRKEGFDIYLKKELMQITDSIKARGVVYTLLQLSEKHKRKGVITISTGNLAVVLCHYGRKFRIPVTVVLPVSTSRENVAYCKQYENPQTTVLNMGKNMVEAHIIALNIAKVQGLFYLDGNNHSNMIIGQATLGLEIMSQNSCADTVLLPTTINGCGLSLGITIAIKGCNRAVKIIEIHSENTDTLFHRLTRHTTTTMELDIPEREYQTCKTNFRQSVFDEIIHVEESLVEQTREYLHRAEGYRDYYAAIALAPILAEMMNDLKGRRVVVPIYGRMDSTKDLEERGLTARAGPLKTIWM